MKEILSPMSVERLMLFVAVIGPLFGLVVGIVLGAHERFSAPRILAGFLIGLVGSLIYGMWRLYNVITDALGLDSVLNLGVQLLIFAALGAAIGVAIPRISSRIKKLVK